MLCVGLKASIQTTELLIIKIKKNAQNNGKIIPRNTKNGTSDYHFGKEQTCQNMNKNIHENSNSQS